MSKEHRDKSGRLPRGNTLDELIEQIDSSYDNGERTWDWAHLHVLDWKALKAGIAALERTPSSTVANEEIEAFPKRLEEQVHFMTRQAQMLAEEGNDVSADVMNKACGFLHALWHEVEQERRFKYKANLRADAAEAAVSAIAPMPTPRMIEAGVMRYLQMLNPGSRDFAASPFDLSLVEAIYDAMRRADDGAKT